VIAQLINQVIRRLDSLRYVFRGGKMNMRMMNHLRLLSLVSLLGLGLSFLPDHTLIRRLPHLRLDPEHPPVLKSSLLFRGFHSLPAVY